jgi:hypothetical protein
MGDTPTVTVEKPLSKPRWMVLVTIVLSMMALAAAGVLYTGHVDGQREVAERESDRRWCELLNTLDQAYSTVPPSTELGRRVADAIRKLRTDLDC